MATIAGAPANIASFPEIRHHPTHLGDYVHVPAKKIFLESYIQKVVNPILFGGKESPVRGNIPLILGGLDQVKKAFHMSANGQVSGVKLVIVPGMTPPDAVTARL